MIQETDPEQTSEEEAEALLPDLPLLEASDEDRWDDEFDQEPEDDGEIVEWQEVPFLRKFLWRIAAFKGPRALVLLKNREIEVLPVKEPTVQGRCGLYGVEAGGMYHNPAWIPPGFITVHTQDDPEPIHADRKPRGYNAKFLEIHTGDYPVHTMGGGLKSRAMSMDLKNMLMLAGGGIVVGYWLVPMFLGGG